MPPPPKTKDELAEVERALSVLKGRHPEHERIAREEGAAAAARQKIRDTTASDESRTVRTRRVKQAAVGLVVVGIFVVVGTLFQREVARRGRIEQSSDAYRAMGFVIVDTSSRSVPGLIDTKLEDACYAIASTDASKITTKVGARTIEGPAPVVFCTCQTEPASITADVAPGGGLTLLKIAPDRLGGSLGFPYLPFTPKTLSKETDAACTDRSLDAWLAAKRAPALDADDKWIGADPKRAGWAGVAAKELGVLPSAKPFATFEAPASSCLLAISTSPVDKLSIRQAGGAMLVTNAPGSFVWCAASAYAGTIHREGAGVVTLVAVPGAKVGGLLGVRELATQAGIVMGQSGMPPADYTWNAKQLLLASSVPEQLVTTSSTVDITPDTEARLAALSFGTPNALLPEVAEGGFSYCQPSLGDKAGESLCVFSGPQTWRAGGANVVGGIARSKLPFWLFGLQGASDPNAMKVATMLAVLARRLKHEGFEPTTLEAVTETATGIDVLGRSKEDAVVAVGLSVSPPFVFPYAPDGAAWTLDGKPRVVTLVPPNSATMTTSVKPLPPKNKRSTVVFRRQTR